MRIFTVAGFMLVLLPGMTAATAAEHSTRNRVETGRGPNPNAYKGVYRHENALLLYETVLTAPFELTLITVLHRDPYTLRF